MGTPGLRLENQDDAAGAVSREERALLHSILESTTAAIYVKDREGRYLVVNGAVERVLQRPRSEILGTTNADLFDAATAAKLARDDQHVLDTGETLPVETTVPGPGGPRVFAGDKGPLRDAAGRLTGVVGVATDVTWRTHSEQRLARSERDLAEAHRVAGLGTWEWDPAARTIRLSEGLERILGLDRAGVEGTPEWLRARLHPDDVAALAATVETVMRDRVPAQIEHGWFGQDAEPRVLLTHLSPNEHDPETVRGTSQDVTELRAAETRLTASLRQNELILGASSEGIWGLDRNSEMTLVNAAAARMLGWEAEELRGRQMHETVHHSRPDGSPYPLEECPVHSAVADGVALHLHADVFWRADGTSMPVELSLNPVHEDGELVGAVMSMRDITERQEAERQRDEDHAELRALERERARLLRHLDRAQEQERRRIAADIHDDSVQAMSAVALRLELLALRTTDTAAREALGELDSTVAAALSRLRSLLFDLTPPGLEHGGLGKATRTALEQLGDETGIAWSVVDQTELELSLERRTVAYRILQEAVANVRRHARARHVLVELTDREEGVHVRVVDDGVGMDVDAAQQPRPGHLGVTSMRQRAELSGGWWAIASAPGAGAGVEFWIPRESPAGADAAARA